MRRLFSTGVLGTVLAVAMPVWAQNAPASSQPVSTGDTRPATTTADGDTGIWFVPTAEVLQHKKWSMSFYRTNMDDGQGFSDISTFPLTFGVGVGRRAELFGNFVLIKSVDRDTRPLFFPSTAAEADSGTGGGILLDSPYQRSPWSGRKGGDLSVGVKFNLASQADEKPVAAAIRARVKFPTAGTDSEDSQGTGQTDFQFDGIVSSRRPGVELSGFGGVIVRGNPEGYKLTNGFRWGFGADFPQDKAPGLHITTELFGESYFDKAITSPVPVGVDGSVGPTTTNLKSPVIFSLGGTWQHPNGFFLGIAGSWNMTQEGRQDAVPASGYSCTTCTSDGQSKDKLGLQVRLGYRPGVRKYVPPPPPPAPAPPVAPPPAPPPTNAAPTVTASCSPSTLEPGQTATLTADARDPDGDALTYQWRVSAGTVSAPTNRQTPFTAPTAPGSVTATVTVDDGHQHQATATAQCNVPAPQRRVYTFEDVHFDFDRYTVRPDALRILDEAIAAMQQDATLNLTIEGHTDSIGTNEYNMALGERRANSVRDYLVSRGIAATRLRTVSFGEENPKYDNTREETRRLNRRAALVVRLSPEPLPKP